jgi:hypothetical protein
VVVDSGNKKWGVVSALDLNQAQSQSRPLTQHFVFTQSGYVQLLLLQP